MASRKELWASLVILMVLAAEGCTGFGTNCSTDADCQATNPLAVCDPTLKVCFVYSGPAVTNIQPGNQSTGVAVANGQVVATFSTSVVDAGPGTFLVVGQGFNTFGSYSVNPAGTQATFEPLAGGFALGTEYTVNLTAGIEDTAGNPLLPFQSTFSTADGVFGSGGTLRFANSTGNYTISGNYFGSLITAVDLNTGGGVTNDFALAVGVADAGTNPTVTTFLQNVVGEEVNNPSVAIAPTGNAFATWTSQPTDGGSGFTAYVATFNGTTHAWETPFAQVGDAGVPLAQLPVVVAFDDTVNHDDGLLVWLESIGGTEVVHGNYHNANAGWIGPGSIQTDNTLNASNFTVSADYAGNALVAWQSEQTSGPSAAVVAFLGIGGSPPPPVTVSNPVLTSISPQASLGIAGLGAVVWASTTALTDGGLASAHVFASTFDLSRNPAFTAARQLDTASFFANYPQVGVAANGNAFAIWQEPGAIVTSSYTKATDTWSAPVMLDSDPTRLLNGPTVAVDPGGNAIANWLKVTPDAGYQMFGERYTLDAGWHGQTQLTIGSDPVRDILPVIAIDGQGRTVTLETRTPTNTSYLEFIPFHVAP